MRVTTIEEVFTAFKVKEATEQGKTMVTATQDVEFELEMKYSRQLTNGRARIMDPNKRHFIRICRTKLLVG